MRSSADYLAAIRDEREVWVDGERVADVTSHPAFAPIARTIGELFDLAGRDGSGMTYSAPETGADANLVLGIPRSRDDLAARRAAITTWARHTKGWVGRSPDHVGSFLAAFAAHADRFGSDGEHDFAENVRAYHRRVLDESLYVSYAIIPPQTARSASAAGTWDGEFIQAGVVARTEEGIIVRGAQMLATGATVADEIFISCIRPLSPADAPFAVSFALPVATPGLKLICRRPYADERDSTFDYPLSSQFDETDALVVFDDVLVPWDRVFVDQDPDRVRAQFFETGAHVLGNWQAQVRFSVKLRFLAGLARRIAEVNGADRIPAVQEKLGHLASITSLVESATLAAEYEAAPDAEGMWRPSARAVYGAMGLQAELYPRVVAIVRELAGGGLLQLPSSTADLLDSPIRPVIDHYMQSPATSAVDRIKLFKLAWDAVGSEFAGRHLQYEMFYAGAPFVAAGYAFRNFDYDDAVAEVDDLLGRYDLEDAR